MGKRLRSVSACASACTSASTSAAALELVGVHKHFGAVQVLRGIDLCVQPGECLAIVGANGAGKTTLLDVLSGGCTPSAGRVLLDGVRIDGLAPHAIHQLGLARSFQRSMGFGRLSVWDNLRCAVMWGLGYRYACWLPLSALRTVSHRANEWLARLELEALRNDPVATLPYAQRRALEVGMALAGEARVLLLDEPTSGMGRAQTLHFLALLRTLTQGRTTIVVEHDMDVVAALADRVAVLADGVLAG
ncbi:branched-chain amino acid transporter ATP-binding protein [Candidatus Symbiobacter mobilis CR]|uniref:Branched-chain amino acid transporter ATP-binding protein n=2 Tax=Candidatus Symbiobacter TaxID=1436289 RepID=U5NAM1_9BURK|nr:branched-chain amino acid transporter ATP-binding protein [Candidatus Symbiobacter mobilis CR]